MRTVSVFVTTLLFIGAAHAQTFTTPPGYLTTEGLSRGGGTINGYAYMLGSFADGRFQIVDSEVPTTVTILTSLGYRHDYRNHGTTTAMGRTWSNVTLDLSDGNIATMSTTFTANQLSTPARVFSGSVTWPSQVGNPSSQPAPWATQLAFPFNQQTTYVHTGNADLCHTYEFSGGTLANAGAWAGSTRSAYYLDGEYAVTSITYGRNVFKYIGTTNGTNCKDPGASATYAAGPVQVGLYSPAYTANPAFANTAQLQVFGSGTAPNAPVIHAFGANGTTPGLATQAFFDCYNLMIDLTQVVIYVTDTTNASGSRTWQYIKIGDLPALAKVGSFPIWSQAAWTHSTSKRTALTTAERCTANYAYPVAKDLADKKIIYQYNTTSTTGFGPYNTPAYLPITRYN